MSIHSGHRERVKKRYREEGLDGFAPHQVLEMILFYCIPRQDTNPLAHRLLDTFGSLEAVLHASPKELKKVEGVSDGVADYLTMFRSVARFCRIQEAQTAKILKSAEDCGNYLLPHFYNLSRETVYLLCLDAKCQVLCCKKLGEGSVNTAAVPIRRIVETALADNAVMVILAHNHPSGLAIPSGEDVQTTRRLAVALDTVDITLADHIVVADNDFVSMTQSGFYRAEECCAMLYQEVTGWTDSN